MSIATVSPMNIINLPISKESQSIKKLTLLKRVAQIFSDLYQKISHLFSRKPNPIMQLTEKNKEMEALINDLYKRINGLYTKMSLLKSDGRSHGVEIPNLKQDISPRNSSFQTNAFRKEDIIYATPNPSLPPVVL